MNTEFVIAVAVVAALLLSCEIWWRLHSVQGELSRKFVHLTVGTFVAFWPFFLSWNQIRIMSLAFLIVVVTSKQFHIFRSIHSVKRPTWGEVLFAVSVGLLTFITHDKWLYAACLLQMSLADGLAAVIGVRARRQLRYKVLGHTKSVPGSLTFFVVSFLILLAFQQQGGTLSLAEVVLISSGATILENVGGMGLDNLFVPLFAALLLRFL